MSYIYICYITGMSSLLNPDGFEKQALGPVTLLNALNGIAGKGNMVRTMGAIGSMETRARGAIDLLKYFPSQAGIMPGKLKTYIATELKPWENLLKATKEKKHLIEQYSAMFDHTKPVYEKAIENYVNKYNNSKGARHALQDSIFNKIISQ